MSRTLQEVIAAAEAMLGGDLHPDRSRFQSLSQESGLADTTDATALGYLAILLDRIGFRDESAQILQYGYAVFADSDGIEEAVLRNIDGILATGHGEYQKALASFEQALPLTRDAVDIRARIIANMAAIDMRTGHVADALRRIDEIRSMQARIPLSIELASTSVEANAALRADDVEAQRRAAGILREATERRIAELGTDHPQAVAIAANLAAVELDAARAESSSEHLKAVNDLLEVVSCRLASEFGVDHPQTLVALANVASAQMDLAIREGAPQRMEHAISSLMAVSQQVESVLGAEHPHSLTVTANLAASQLELARADMSGDRLRQAVDSLASAANRMSDVFGSDHPDTVQVQANLASAELDLARSKGSTDALMHAAELLTVTAERAVRVLGPSHRVTRLATGQLRICQSLLRGSLPPDRLRSGAAERVNSDQNEWRVEEEDVSYQAATQVFESGASPSELQAPPAQGQVGANRLLFRMLGPLEIRAGEQWLGIRTPKERSILAALLINLGEVVSRDTLNSEMGYDAKRRPAAHTDKRLISGLRRLLTDINVDLESVRGGGYLLRVTAGKTDVQLFESMVRDGRRALATGEPERAEYYLAEALALWHGDPLANVPRSALVSAEVERLGELRLDAIELLVTAQLAYSSHAQVVPELRRLLADHPQREGLWMLLMRALDRSGLHAEALETYSRARDVIRDQLGVDPGPELRSAYDDLLAKHSLTARDDAIGSPVRQPEGRLLTQHPTQLADKAIETLNQHFLVAVQTDSESFGFSGAQAHLGRSYTGRFEEQAIAETTRSYVPPPMFGEAVAALREEHIAILKGSDGSGRRTSAFALLRKATQGPVVALSPLTTTAELAEHHFEENCGYLILGRIEEDLPPEVADFNWHNVRNRLQEAGAFLVMTTGEHRGGQWPGGITQFSWRQPSAADALRAHLDEADCDEQLLTVVANALGPDYPTALISDLARRISVGESAESLLDEVTGAKQQLVADWLNNALSFRDILEVAGLAFTGSVSERIFESLVSRLMDELEARAGNPTEDIKPPQLGIGTPASRRSHREYENPLITVQRETSPGGTATSAPRRVVFRSPEYRALVIDELWKSSDTEFWESVRAWLQAIIANADNELIIGIASGLALFVRHAPNEVINSYLNPWAGGIAGWRGQTAAAYVLWWMSMDDSLAPLALRTAVLWADKDTRAEQETATVVFSGELGACYTMEAARRLCQLGDQGQPNAGRGLAQLFAMLADRQYGAAPVIAMLKHRLVEASASRLTIERSLAWTIEVLTVRDSVTGHPAVAKFMDTNPSRLDDLAYLWARTLRVRKWRRYAIAALRNALEALAASSSDCEALASSIGAAIMRSLSDSEQSQLLVDIRTSWRPVARDDDSESIIDTFLTACAALALEE